MRVWSLMSFPDTPSTAKTRLKRLHRYPFLVVGLFSVPYQKSLSLQFAFTNSWLWACSCSQCEVRKRLKEWCWSWERRKRLPRATRSTTGRTAGIYFSVDIYFAYIVLSWKHVGSSNVACNITAQLFPATIRKTTQALYKLVVKLLLSLGKLVPELAARVMWMPHPSSISDLFLIKRFAVWTCFYATLYAHCTVTLPRTATRHQHIERK